MQHHSASLAPPFSPAEDAICHVLRRRGLTFDQIAAEIGRPSGAAVRARYCKVQARRDDADRQASMDRRHGRVAKERACLCCRARFMSPHAGVRMCDPCRENADEPTPFEP